MTMSVPKQILIADDEPNVRFVFRTALEAAGYQPSTAKDGEEALMWLQCSRPDLVLLDLQMPRIDGMEVLEAMRCSGDDVPVVIVTARGSVTDAVRAMKLGAVDFLEKPLGPATLRSMVADVLARHGRAGYKCLDDGPDPRPGQDRPDHPIGEAQAEKPSPPNASDEPAPTRTSRLGFSQRRAVALSVASDIVAMLGAVLLRGWGPPGRGAQRVLRRGRRNHRRARATTASRSSS